MKQMKKGVKRKRIRIGLAAAVVIVMTVLVWQAVGGATVAGAGGGAEVKVEPAGQEVKAGDSFSVNVMVESVEDLGAGQGVLNFDSSVMQATRLEEGEWLKSRGGTTLPIEIIDNTTGRVAFAYSLTTSGIGVDGSGTLATIYFDTDASAAGVFNLNLTDVLLADGTGNTIPVAEISNGRITISTHKQAPPPPSPSTPATPGFDWTSFTAAVGVLAVLFAIRDSASAGRRRGRRKVK